MCYMTNIYRILFFVLHESVFLAKAANIGTPPLFDLSFSVDLIKYAKKKRFKIIEYMHGTNP